MFIADQTSSMRREKNVLVHSIKFAKKFKEGNLQTLNQKSNKMLHPRKKISTVFQQNQYVYVHSRCSYHKTLHLHHVKLFRSRLHARNGRFGLK